MRIHLLGVLQSVLIDPSLPPSLEGHDFTIGDDDLTEEREDVTGAIGICGIEGNVWIWIGIIISIITPGQELLVYFCLLA